MSRKVAVVTGSNKGIGFSIVKGLCKELKDFDVFLTARDEGRGQEAVAKMQKEFGVTPKFHQLDLTSKESVAKLKTYLEETYGGLDVLVNNAGMAYTAAQSKDTPFAKQAEVTNATNFTGTLNVCDGLFPILRQGARVVHVSSRVSTMALGKCSEAMRKKLTSIDTMEGIIAEIDNFVRATKEGKHKELGYPDSAYGMSKVGVTVMTPIQQAAIVAQRGGQDILINACCPGYVNTDMSSHKGTLTPDQGAETPIYLATLPAGTTSPKGDFLAEKKVLNWRKMTGWSE